LTEERHGSSVANDKTLTLEKNMNEPSEATVCSSLREIEHERIAKAMSELGVEYPRKHEPSECEECDGVGGFCGQTMFGWDWSVCEECGGSGRN